jgi:hypothetical protein
VEEAWRTLKSGLKLRPVYLWAVHRLHAHVALAVLAALLWCQSRVQESATMVMARVVLERLLPADALDAWFERTAKRRYTRELLFSAVFGLMLEVVCGVLIQAPQLSAPAVARALQVSATAIRQWVYLYHHEGLEGITLKGRGLRVGGPT